MSVLHIIPESVFSNTFHGAYKDVLSRVEWFEKNGSEYRQLRIRQDSPEIVEELLSGGAPDHILVEYTHYPVVLRSIRKAFPDARVAVRAHNIEPLQHLDNHGWWPERGPLWMLYGMFRLWMNDVITKQNADIIFSINAWENRVYWNHLPGRGHVEWLPYRCPDHLVPEQPTPYEERRVIACLPTSQENRKSRDLVLRFQQLARQMKQKGCTYEFVVTGRLADWDLPECPEINYTGFVEDLGEFAGRCKAVCMLSPLGYGFKTTIADALAAGANVLAHPKIFRRCPEIVKPGIIPVDICNPADVDTVIETLKTESANHEIHTGLCAVADTVLCRWAGGETT